MHLDVYKIINIAKDTYSLTSQVYPKFSFIFFS